MSKEEEEVPPEVQEWIDAGWNWLEEETLTKEEWFELVAKPLNPDLTWEEFEKEWDENTAPMIAENRRKAMH